MNNSDSAGVQVDVHEEPRCLISPESKWYQPGRGFTCRQIMLPLLIITGLLILMAIAQAIVLARTSEPVLADWFLALSPWIMLALSIRAILFVRSSLLNPLTQVRQWVSRVRAGEMSARMPQLPNGEFNELAGDINGLASVMESLHDDLECEVKIQTAKLAHKTESLELLYEVVTSVNVAYEIEDLLIHFMHRLGEVFSADAAVVRILKDSNLEIVDSYGFGENSQFTTQTVPIRFVLKSGVFGKGVIDVRAESLSVVSIDGIPDGNKGTRSKNSVARQIVSIPLQYRDSILGCYQIFINTSTDLPRDFKELLISIGQHLGVAIEQSRLDSNAGILMMIEERAKLANELHDSLAQTLASLRFQTRVLDETLHQGDEQVTWDELDKLERQVEEANKELRLLIGQFRAPLQAQEVVLSVEKLIRKFRQDSGAAVFFQNEWSDDSLSSEMRNDVIRIIQEALSNIKKHADAKTVRVLIRHHGDRYRIMVEDDGIGYDESKLLNDSPGEHIGRQIMRERSENLGAVLRLDSEPGEGSLISLEFEDSCANPDSVDLAAAG